MSPISRTPPRELRSVAFRAADALTLGVTRGALRSSRYHRLHQGVYRVADAAPKPSDTPESIVALLAKDYAILLRKHEAFSHTAALLLAGAPIRARPDLHVCIPLPANRAQGKHVLGHRTAHGFEPRLLHSGIPIVPIELALLQSASQLRLHELVVAIDYFLLTPEFLVRPAAQRLDRERFELLLKHSQVRGIRRLCAAYSLARDGAQSRMESLTRLELVRLGIDIFDLQVPLYARNGEWIGRFDLVNRKLRLIIEFDGDQHRTDRQQYLKDLVRLERVEMAGYRVLRLHSEDFWSKNIERTHARILTFVGQHLQQRVPAEIRRYLSADDQALAVK